MAIEVPKVIKTGDGTVYEIPPAGAIGSYTWVRQAALVRNAYRQIGKTMEAAKWDAEYNKRRAFWDAIERGKDYAAVVAQFGLDFLAAPFRIVIDAAGAAEKVGKGTLKLIDALPYILAGLLIVAGIGFFKGTLKVSR